MDEVAPDLWQVVGPDFRMPAGVRIPSSSIVIRLPDRTLVVYSPLAFDDAAAASIEAAGEVAHLVVPSRFHHLFAAAASARWPRATVHASPGIADKQPGLRIDRQLPGDPAPAWRDVLLVELVGGVPKLDEVVLFHRPSGTLVCADLVFNITRPANLRTRAALAVTGVGGRRLAQSREWSWACKDRPAARASVHRIAALPIARVAPCHGDPIEIDAAGLAARMTRLYGGRPVLV